MNLSPSLTAWYASAKFQGVAIGLLIALALAEAVVGVGLRDNDFLWHREHGEFFLAKRVDRDHYLPSRGLIDSSLTFLPYRLTRGIVYALSLLFLVVCYRCWEAMAARLEPAPIAIGRAAAFFSVMLFLPYLVRDLDECGLQIILLFCLTLCGFALSLGRSGQAGFWLATAIAYKVTPLLFLPFLLWKRQWRAATWTALFLGVWCAAPALYTGWTENVHAHERWGTEALRLKAVRQAYPSLLDREPPQIYNLSLNAAIARYLETYPPEHPLFVNHAGFVQFGDLSPTNAYYVLNGILAVLGLGYAWKTRLPWSKASDSGAFITEWATVCALCALLSPLCWKHHFVLVLPCVFLLVRRRLVSPFTSSFQIILFSAITGMVYGSRDFIAGREFGSVLLSYKVDTFAMVTLVLWTLATTNFPGKSQKASTSSSLLSLSRAA